MLALVVLALLLVALVAGAAYLSGVLGATRGEVQTLSITSATATMPPAMAGAPDEAFFQIDAAVNYDAQRWQPFAAGRDVDVFGFDVQPVGAYIPRSGDTRFELPPPLTLPTPLPYPTSPPLPLPLPPPTAAPDNTVPEPDAPPTAIPFQPQGGQHCAPIGWPAEGPLTQRFHMYHPGIDIGVPPGSPVVATHSGQVIFTGWNDIGYGYLVILQSGPFITYYGHNTSFNVVEGQFVGRGSIIAWSGSTGNSSGPHIHYETRINDLPVDPLTFESRGFPGC
ncbi:MAG: M23 family metallopeptidase [Phototrophicaceae bacterium]